MLTLSILGKNLLDDPFDYSFDSHKTFDMMNTDTKDIENGYETTMNMPGVKKEDVKAELRDGYLTMQAITDPSEDEKGLNGTYICRERYTGSCSRSSYAGDVVAWEDIKVKFEDGTPKMLVPKKEAKPTVEEKKYTAIEG